MKQIFLFVFVFIAHQVSGFTNSRLVAKSSTNYNGTSFYRADSTEYIYFYPDIGGDLKSARIPFYDAVSYMFDTILGVPQKTLRSMQILDANSHPSISSNYKWTGMWQETDNFLFSITKEDSLTSETYQFWDFPSMGWLNSTKKDFSFDAYLHRTNYTLWNWIGGKWVGNEKYDYTYDAKHLKIRSIFTQWDAGLSVWKNVFLDSFFYNSADQIVLNTEYIWDAGSATWKHFKRTVNTYNSSGLLELLSEEAWDNTISNWRNGAKTEYTYSSAGNLIKRVNYVWNVTDAYWMPLGVYLNDYDAVGNMISETIQRYNAIDSVFENSSRLDYEYDASKNKVKQIAYLFNLSTGKFDNDQLDSFVYNSYNQLVYATYYTLWNDTDKYWYHNISDQEFRYYYQEYGSSIKQPNTVHDATVSIAPNPARTTLTVDFKQKYEVPTQFRIYDLQGRLIKELQYQQLPNLQVMLDISSLSGGQYFLRVNNAYLQIPAFPFIIE